MPDDGVILFLIWWSSTTGYEKYKTPMVFRAITVFTAVDICWAWLGEWPPLAEASDWPSAQTVTE